jgi:DNA-binding NtrC family response regulator
MGMSETQQRLLMLIGAEANPCRVISSLAAREGWQTLLLRDASDAIAMLAEPLGMALGAICIDMTQSPAGCGVFGELRARADNLPIVALCDTIEQAVRAVRAGASDFLLKPLVPERIVAALRSAAPVAGGRRASPPLSEKLDGGRDFDSMIGAAPAFRAALAVAAKAARGHGRVLVEGEPGTGKEMLIHAMLETGPRARAPLRIVNAGLTQAATIESLLFGHEKDAFPGAFERRVGAIQECDCGTLVIDEIEYLPAPLQERLLQFLRDGMVRPIGAMHAFRVDVRVIAAANVRLATLTTQGRFLSDLFEALTPVVVELPSLRDRVSDIPALARHFLSRFAATPGLGEIAISDAALAMLTRSDWPGNVRELQTTLFRAAVACEGGTLTADDFVSLVEICAPPEPNVVQMPAFPEAAGVTLYTSDGNLRPLEDIEGDVIRLALGHYRGRMTEIARRLGIGRSTLYRKLSELGIDNAA